MESNEYIHNIVDQRRTIMENTKQKLLHAMNKSIDSHDPDVVVVYANAYATLVQTEIQEKMTNYGMNHCPECGKHDELDTEEIG